MAANTFSTPSASTDVLIDYAGIFGSSVKLLRKSQGLTQERLAEKANVPIDTIKRVEKGAVSKIDTACQIASALGVTVDSLLKSRPADTVALLHDAMISLATLASVIEK